MPSSAIAVPPPSSRVEVEVLLHHRDGDDASPGLLPVEARAVGLRACACRPSSRRGRTRRGRRGAPPRRGRCSGRGTNDDVEREAQRRCPIIEHQNLSFGRLGAPSARPTTGGVASALVAVARRACGHALACRRRVVGDGEAAVDLDDVLVELLVRLARRRQRVDRVGACRRCVRAARSGRRGSRRRRRRRRCR